MQPAQAKATVALRRPRERDRARPHGVTLLELILVLALVVAITAVAGTNLRGTFRQQRLRKAAEQVQTEWTRARVDAIKSGRVHVFHYAPERAEYMLVSQESLDDLPVELVQATQGYVPAPRSVTGSSGVLGRNAAGGLGSQRDSLEARQRKLPEAVVFLGAEVMFDQRSVVQLNESADPTLVTQQMLGLREAASQPDQWGMPIYFYPDGTSSTAQLMLVNDSNQAIRVYLRGLTGLVRLGSVERADVAGNLGRGSSR